MFRQKTRWPKDIPEGKAEHLSSLKIVRLVMLIKTLKNMQPKEKTHKNYDKTKNCTHTQNVASQLCSLQILQHSNIWAQNIVLRKFDTDIQHWFSVNRCVHSDCQELYCSVYK